MLRISEKLDELKKIIQREGKVAVAFSGGVDSTLLLKVCHDTLGENAVAITAQLNSVPKSEMEESKEFCSAEGIVHHICKIDELQIPEFSANVSKRCYYCKKHIMKELIEKATELGISCLVEGSNVDDLSDYRPGRKALTELWVKSPLLEAGLTKDEIRKLSRQMGLSTAHKPSNACLASRIPTGEEITREKLIRVDKAENILHELGFYNIRVRSHDNIARIEVMPEDISKIAEPNISKNISTELHRCGFRYVSLDLDGYKTGNLNS